MIAAILAGLKAFATLCGFGEKVTAEIHDHNQRVAGEDGVIAQDNAASAKVNEDVAKAAVSATDAGALDRLRNGKF
jgi:hypothetical protein